MLALEGDLVVLQAVDLAADLLPGRLADLGRDGDGTVVLRADRVVRGGVLDLAEAALLRPLVVGRGVDGRSALAAYAALVDVRLVGLVVDFLLRLLLDAVVDVDEGVVVVVVLVDGEVVVGVDLGADVDAPGRLALVVAGDEHEVVEGLVRVGVIDTVTGRGDQVAVLRLHGAAGAPTLLALAVDEEDLADGDRQVQVLGDTGGLAALTGRGDDTRLAVGGRPGGAGLGELGGDGGVGEIGRRGLQLRGGPVARDGLRVTGRGERRRLGVGVGRGLSRAGEGCADHGGDHEGTSEGEDQALGSGVQFSSLYFMDHSRGHGSLGTQSTHE